MSLRSRDNIQAKCTELVVIRARMSDLLWVEKAATRYGEDLRPNGRPLNPEEWPVTRVDGAGALEVGFRHQSCNMHRRSSGSGE